MLDQYDFPPPVKWAMALVYAGLGVAILVLALRDGFSGLVPLAGVLYLAGAAGWALRGFRQKQRMNNETTVENREDRPNE